MNAISPRARWDRKTLSLVVAALAAAVIGALLIGGSGGSAGGRSDGQDFWESLSFGAEFTKVYGFGSIDDLKPGAQSKTPEGRSLRPGQAVIRGTVVDLEPGKAFAAGGDGMQAPTVGFNDRKAVFRWVKAVVRVDEVLAGKLPKQHSSELRLEFGIDRDTSLEDLKREIGGAGEGIYIVDNVLEGMPQVGDGDPGYYADIFRAPGDAVFIRDGADGVRTPFWDNGVKGKALKGITTFEDLARDFRGNRS